MFIPLPSSEKFSSASSLRRDSASAYRGALGLTFAVTADGDGAPVQTELPPLTVTAPANVHIGELICVQGWIRIEGKLAEGTDGFMIYESHGGPALAQRYYETDGWKRFAFYRYAATEGDMTLTFSLCTHGQVCLDEVSVQPVR